MREANYELDFNLRRSSAVAERVEEEQDTAATPGPEPAPRPDIQIKTN